METDGGDVAEIAAAMRREEALARGGGKRAILASAVITQLLIVMGVMTVTVALPKIQVALGLSTDQRTWMMTAYTLAFGGSVLVGGHLTAVLGTRWAYVTGLIGFGLLSLVAGLASSFTLPVAARAIQGGFAALMAPSVLALISTTFTKPADRARVFAVIGATGGVALAVGMILGGALTTGLSWRWCLYVNAPIAALSLLAGFRALPTPGKRGREDHIVEDVPGLVLGGAGVFSLVYGLSQAEQHGWGATATIVWLVAGGLLAVLFVLRERLAHTPVLPLWVVTHPVRAASNLAQFFAGGAQLSSVLVLSYYFEDHLGYSPLMVGVAFLPVGAR